MRIVVWRVPLRIQWRACSESIASDTGSSQVLSLGLSVRTSSWVCVSCASVVSKGTCLNTRYPTIYFLSYFVFLGVASEMWNYMRSVNDVELPDAGQLQVLVRRVYFLCPHCEAMQLHRSNIMLCCGLPTYIVSHFRHSITCLPVVIVVDVSAKSFSSDDKSSSLVHCLSEVGTQECMSKHMHSSAIFFADKLVSLSEGAPRDVYVLAEVRQELERAVCSLRCGHAMHVYV